MTRTHRYFQRSVGPLVDGELTRLGKEDEIRSHLAECEECNDEAELIIRMKEVLRRLSRAGRVSYPGKSLGGTSANIRAGRLLQME